MKIIGVACDIYLENALNSVGKIRCFYILRQLVNVATTGLKMITKIMNRNFV